MYFICQTCKVIKSQFDEKKQPSLIKNHCFNFLSTFSRGGLFYGHIHRRCLWFSEALKGNFPSFLQRDQITISFGLKLSLKKTKHKQLRDERLYMLYVVVYQVIGILYDSVIFCQLSTICNVSTYMACLYNLNRRKIVPSSLGGPCSLQAKKFFDFGRKFVQRRTSKVNLPNHLQVQWW